MIRRVLASVLHYLAALADESLVELDIDDHDGLRTITVYDHGQKLRATYSKE